MSSIRAYYPTVWNLLDGSWCPSLCPSPGNPLILHTDLHDVRTLSTNYEPRQGDVEVIFQADIDSVQAPRNGETISVDGPWAIENQMAAAILHGEEWTDWMTPTELWVYLLERNGLRSVVEIPGEITVIQISVAARRIARQLLGRFGG